MDANKLSEREFAVQQGLDSLSGVTGVDRWMALISLRSVALQLDLERMHTVIDLEIKALYLEGL